MSEQKDIDDILSGNDIGLQIVKATNSDDRFSFLEALRKSAIQSRAVTAKAAKISDITVNLLDAESLAIQGQFERIDNALVQTLTREGRLSSLNNYSRDDDPDLPDDPSSLSDRVVAYRYGLMRLYRRQFEVSVNEQKDGAWPLIINDLVEPIDGKRQLLIDVFPEAASIHNSPDFLESFSSARAAAAELVLQKMQADIVRRLADASSQQLSTTIHTKGKAEIIVKILRELWKWSNIMVQAVDVYRTAKELKEAAAAAAEQAKREQEAREAWKEAFGREPREIEHSSDHVDSFDRNHDIIGRTC